MHTATKGPTLGAVIHERLLQHQQPRTAAEVTTDLSQALPDRRVGTPVVRSTLEQLVAKGRVTRSRQGRSVFYTADASPADSVVTAAAEAAETSE
ncbi:BlaI/MecI/CopY family transcriptional regulator [Streptomyces sp. NPDC001902]